MKYRVYTGPVPVKEVAEGFKKVSGVDNVWSGTEHVYFDFDGDKHQLEMVMMLATSATLINAYRSCIMKMPS